MRMKSILAVLVLTAIAFGQEGPEILPVPPVVKTPTLTFKPERNANSTHGQEFIRLLMVSGVHTEPAVDAAGAPILDASGNQQKKISLATGVVYQRVSSIDHITFDQTAEMSSIETARIYLTNGEWYVIAGNPDENWTRVSEAGPYYLKPAKGIKE